MENEQYFFRVEYHIENGIYCNPQDILETNLHFAKAKKKIIDYNFVFDRVSVGGPYGDDYLVYAVKIFSNLNRNELQKFFDQNTVNSETFIII